jgi:hypothetical protein
LGFFKLESIPRLPRPLLVALKLAAVLVLGVPVASALTFLPWPLWNWLETDLGIESIGHAFPAEWCFVATYLTLSAPWFVRVLWRRKR